MWNEASETRHINDAISEVWQEKYDAIKQQNAELLAALREIAKMEGPYSRDPLTHAENVIENLTNIANKAIAKAEGEG